MKIGIMQPYFFPYIGYFQLMNAVDKYVVYDDVNFINRGWINRNRILINGEPSYFNLPILGASQNKLINEIKVNNDTRLIDKNLRSIHSAYAKAPYFDDVIPVIEKILKNEAENVAEYLYNSFEMICLFLGIKTQMIMSSSIDKDCELHGQDKILQICKILNATEYYNAIGGVDLYNRKSFADNNIQLSFLETKRIEYKQYNNVFQPNLSIIDVMMFNSVEEIQKKLLQYELK